MNVHSIDAYKKITDIKKIPDFGYLYANGIITIQDFLKYRNSSQGKRFREWMSSTEYDPEVIQREFLKSQSTIDNRFLKFFRWIMPDAIGVANPIAGFLASAADSYLVDKFINGWHPNMFLDNYLKEKIDNKIRFKERQDFKALTLRKFPGTQRNDMCPCGSSKKFKNCCGK